MKKLLALLLSCALLITSVCLPVSGLAEAEPAEVTEEAPAQEEKDAPATEKPEEKAPATAKPEEKASATAKPEEAPAEEEIFEPDAAEPAETSSAAETEATAVEEAPVETEAPAEEVIPVETEEPAENELPQETELPTETEMPAPEETIEPEETEFHCGYVRAKHAMDIYGEAALVTEAGEICKGAVLYAEAEGTTGAASVLFASDGEIYAGYILLSEVEPLTEEETAAYTESRDVVTEEGISLKNIAFTPVAKDTDFEDEYNEAQIDLLPDVLEYTGEGLIDAGKFGTDGLPEAVTNGSAIKTAYVTCESLTPILNRETTFVFAASGGTMPYKYTVKLYKLAYINNGAQWQTTSLLKSTTTTGNQFTYTFTQSGKYAILLTVTDSAGNYARFWSAHYDTVSASDANSTSTLYGKVRSIVSQCCTSGMSDYQKAKALHDYLINHAYYPDVSKGKKTYYYEASGVLLYGVGVCQSYSLAYQMLLKEAGIESVYVCGLGNGGLHSWNEVKLDGAWYCVDCTWDDPYSASKQYAVSGSERSTYFAITKAQLAKDHVWNETNRENAQLVPDAVATFVITKEPANVTVSAGGTASFSVTVTGSGISYQWQYKYAGSSTWYSLSGSTSASVGIVANAAQAGLHVRCRVSNSSATLYSKEAVITIGGTTGSCSWKFDGSTLTITGSGATASYSSGTPWDSIRTSIKTVSVGSGVTSIGNYLLSGLTYMTSVSLPSSLRIIGSYAFYGDSSIAKITVPDAVTSIGSGAFSSCSALTVHCTDGTYAARWCASNGVRYTTAIHYTISASSKLTVYLGETWKLDPASGTSFSTVKSSKTSVLTADNTGMLKPVYPGTAKVTVTTTAGKKYTVTVTVKDPNPATAVTINEGATASMYLDQTKTLNVVTTPSNAASVISCTSSSTKIATVSISADGRTVTVKPVKEGTVTVTVKTSSGKSAKIKITITDRYKATAVAITAPSGAKYNASGAILITAGTSIQLGASLTPSYSTSKPVTWKSSSKSVATVDASGKVTGMKAGTVTVTATTTNGKKATQKVVVLANKKDGISSAPSAYRISTIASRSDKLALDLKSVEISSGKIIAQFYVINGFSGKVTRLTNFTFTVRVNGTDIASKTVSSMSMSVSPRGYKLITVTFTGSDVKNTAYDLTSVSASSFGWGWSGTVYHR